jgi:UDP-glucuronate decarboxylase
MKILVTGGTGFLGSHLSEALLELGHTVLCLDNGITGSIRNVEHLLNRKDFFYVEHDVKNSLEMEVNGIFNLACPASPPKYQRDPVDTFMTSILGANNLLKLALQNSARILQASTSEIYGDPTVSPQAEGYWGNVNCYGLRACYDEGKRGAETLFFDYQRLYGADTRIARIFNTYGPKMAQDDGRVVSNFIIQALSGEPLTIYGDGTQTRSLCYVSDLVDGLIKLFFKDEVDGPVNLGNPQPINMISLATEIRELTNSKSDIVFLPLPSDDPVDRLPDIDKAKSILHWFPKIDRRDGLQKTIKYFDQTLGTRSK